MSSSSSNDNSNSAANIVDVSSESINTDGRKPFDCYTRYPQDVRKEMLAETIFLFILLSITLIMLFLNWRGLVANWLGLQGEEAIVFRKYAFYAIAGILGGIIFGMKYFYRVVARGYWNQDRRTWRIMSPFIAMVTAFIVGAMIDSNLMSSQQTMKSSTIVAIAFLAGYFADEAVGKMYEVASIIFGKSSAMKSGSGK